MNKTYLLTIPIVLLLSACGSKVANSAENMAQPMIYQESYDGDRAVTPMPLTLHSTIPKRMVTTRADISVEVDDIKDAKKQLLSLVESFSGHIENARLSEGGYYHASIKVPSDKLMPTLEAIDKLGDKISQSINRRDITKSFINMQERLKNLKLFRDKMKSLLSQTTKIKEILQVERELNRVQTEIDMIESQMKNMKGSVDMSPIEVSLKEKTVYGPLGYVGNGLWWVVKKLFVIK